MVAGMPGAVTKVTVKLNSITHTKPTDIDMLLIGPGGQTAIMMSHAGGGFPGITNVTLTLDDSAANPLPAGSSAPTVVTGTYQPANYGGVNVFVPPSPKFMPSPSSALSVFNGTDPNGTWSLYVVDNTITNVGNVAGEWELDITTDTCPTPSPTPTAIATFTLQLRPRLGDTNGYSDSHSYICSYSHSYIYSDSYSYVYSDSHGYIYAYGYSYITATAIAIFTPTATATFFLRTPPEFVNAGILYELG